MRRYKDLRWQGTSCLVLRRSRVVAWFRAVAIVVVVLSARQGEPADKPSRAVVSYLGLDSKTVARVWTCPSSLTTNAPLPPWSEVVVANFKAKEWFDEQRRNLDEPDIVPLLNAEVELVKALRAEFIGWTVGSYLSDAGLDGLRLILETGDRLRDPCGLTCPVVNVVNELVKYKANQNFLRGQLNAYLCEALGGQLDMKRFSTSLPFDRSRHDQVWADGDPYLFPFEIVPVCTACVSFPGVCQLSPIEDVPDLPLYLRLATRQAWQLAHAHYLLEIDRGRIRDGILAAASAGNPVGGPDEARKNGLHVAHPFGCRGFGAPFFLSACSASRSL